MISLNLSLDVHMNVFLGQPGIFEIARRDLLFDLIKSVQNCPATVVPSAAVIISGLTNMFAVRPAAARMSWA